MKVTLDTINVSNNNLGVYIHHVQGDNVLLNFLSSGFTFNTNGALNAYLNGSESVNMELYDTLFTENKGDDDTVGTAVYAILDSHNSAINITFCNFLSNTGGSSIVQFSVLQNDIQEHFEFINLFIYSSNFTSNRIGSALHLTYCVLKFYSSTLFQDNSAKTGGAIYVTESSQITVDDESTV